MIGGPRRSLTEQMTRPLTRPLAALLYVNCS
jgi:hypothetical protein